MIDCRTVIIQVGFSALFETNCHDVRKIYSRGILLVLSMASNEIFLIRMLNTLHK